MILKPYRRLSPLRRWLQKAAIKAHEAIVNLCLALIDNEAFPWALAAFTIGLMILGQAWGMR